MKRFLAGIFLGALGSAVVLMAQHRASEKMVEPQPVFENQKVKIVRWVLKPGEGTTLHTHQLDHVGVIIHGSKMKDVDVSGAVKEREAKTGDALYVPGTGLSHSFANVGEGTYESISIELK